MTDEIQVTQRQMDDTIVAYQDPESERTPLVVRVAISLYEMGQFEVAQGTVSVVFDIFLMYDDAIYENTFGSIRDGLPWTMPNALELNVAGYGTYKMYAADLDSLQPFAKRQKLDAQQDSGLFRVEMFTCRGVLKLITFPSEDPFQSIYLVLKLAMDGTPGSEMTQFKASGKECFFPGARQKIGSFSKGSDDVREYSIVTDYGEYSRLFFIFEYKKSPLEDIAKYYVLPLLINALTIAFYETVDSLFDSAGAYFLAIIALLFTLPETGAFTRNEKAVVIGSIWMLVILFVLMSWPTEQMQTILGMLLAASYAILLVYDFVGSRKVNNKYKKVLFEGDLSTLDAI